MLLLTCATDGEQNPTRLEPSADSATQVLADVDNPAMPLRMGVRWDTLQVDRETVYLSGTFGSRPSFNGTWPAERYLAAYDLTANEIMWEQIIEVPELSSIHAPGGLFVDSQNVVYVSNDQLVAVSHDSGERLWSFEPGHDAANIVGGSADQLFVVDGGETLYAINRADGSVADWWRFEGLQVYDGIQAPGGASFILRGSVPFDDGAHVSIWRADLGQNGAWDGQVLAEIATLHGLDIESCVAYDDVATHLFASDLRPVIQPHRIHLGTWVPWPRVRGDGVQLEGRRYQGTLEFSVPASDVSVDRNSQCRQQQARWLWFSNHIFVARRLPPSLESNEPWLLERLQIGTELAWRSERLLGRPVLAQARDDRLLLTIFRDGTRQHQVWGLSDGRVLVETPSHQSPGPHNLVSFSESYLVYVTPLRDGTALEVVNLLTAPPD